MTSEQPKSRSEAQTRPSATSEPPRPRRFWGLLWLTLMLGLGALWGHRPTIPPQALSVVSITGCDEIVSDPPQGYRCGLLPETLQAAQIGTGPGQPPHIEVRMKEPPGGFIVYAAAASQRLERRDGELILSWPLLGELPDLQVHGRHYYLFGSTPLALRLVSYVAPPPREGAAAPAAAPPDAADPAARADELNRLGKDLYDHGRMQGAIAAFAESAELAEQSGQLSLAANSARHHAAIVFRHSKDAEGAAQLLDRAEPLLRLQAIEHAAATFERALYAGSRGDLQRAASFYRQAMAEALAVDYPELRRTIASSFVAFLHQQGEHLLAQEQAEALIKELSSLRLADIEQPCARSRSLGVLARAQLNAAETVPALAQAAAQTLDRALAFAGRDGCVDSAALAYLSVSSARALLLVAAQLKPDRPADRTLLDAQLGQAETHIHRAISALRALSPQQRMDLGEALGRLAVLRGDYASAVVLFRDVEALASQALSADPQYRALIALAVSEDALARTTSSPAEQPVLRRQARQHFANAERLLSDMVLYVPVPAARRGFLPRYEAGLGAYIDSLLAEGDRDEALAVMRRAQVRGLALTFQAGLLSERSAEQVAALQKDATELLQQSLGQETRLSLGGEDTPRSLQEQRQRLDGLMARLRQVGLGELPLRKLLPGEGMLICHALPHDRTACLYALADGRKQSHIVTTAELYAAQAAADAPQRLSRLLLSPFAALIDATAVLRVIPSPLFRSVELAALPYPGPEDGTLVSANRRLVYALDIAPHALPARTAPASPGPPTAPVVVYSHIAGAAQVTPPLLARLQFLGWQPSLYSTPQLENGANPLRRLRCWLGLVNNCREPLLPADGRPWPLFSGSASSVLPTLQGVELAHFYTHAWFGREQGGWQSAILMPDGSMLHASELMRLLPAPRFVVMITCEGGQGGQGQDAEDMSLAQALLLRGGEAVVAASRQLADQVAVQWTQALYSASPLRSAGGPAFLQAARPDLGSAFHAAQRSLQARSPAASDWTALRLYVP
ncbi:MAG TPA: CHAT domain-containing protein [Pseudomonadota bacterium]|nr:CHAT domain-containing protein [Pseudomonadota bacterium]